MTSGGINFNDSPDNQVTKFRVFYWFIPDFYHTPLNFYEVPISLRDVLIVSNSYLTDGRTDGHWESNFVHLSLEM